MSYKILRSKKQKPKDVNEVALVNARDNSFYIPTLDKTKSPDPRFHGRTLTLPAKVFHNSTDNELLNLYTKGVLKWEDTGRTCGNCVNYYPAERSTRGGRCKARGFMDVHPDTPADDTHGWTDPVTGTYFSEWPRCPYFLAKERLSRR